jgi:hypothetical protein
MTPLDVNLQHLIEAIDTDLAGSDPLTKVGEAQQRARSLSDIGDQLIDHFVTQARSSGTPWSQIGEALGVSKQAAQQRWVPPVYERFTNRARHVVVLAQEQARSLRHGYIGTEHILLGILRESQGAASLVLADLAGSLDTVRDAVLAVIPAGTETPPQKIPFTPRAKEALGQSNAQAVEMGHNYVGTEHLLLGLLKVEEGIAAKTLRSLGIGYDEARVGVVNWISTYLQNNPDAAQRVAEALARAADAGLQLDVAGVEAAASGNEITPPSN